MASSAGAETRNRVLTTVESPEAFTRLYATFLMALPDLVERIQKPNKGLFGGPTAGAVAEACTAAMIHFKLALQYAEQADIAELTDVSGYVADKLKWQNIFELMNGSAESIKIQTGLVLLRRFAPAILSIESAVDAVRAMPGDIPFEPPGEKDKKTIYRRKFVEAVKRGVTAMREGCKGNPRLLNWAQDKRSRQEDTLHWSRFQVGGGGAGGGPNAGTPIDFTTPGSAASYALAPASAPAGSVTAAPDPWDCSSDAAKPAYMQPEYTILCAMKAYITEQKGQFQRASRAATEGTAAAKSVKNSEMATIHKGIKDNWPEMDRIGATEYVRADRAEATMGKQADFATKMKELYDNLDFVLRKLRVAWKKTDPARNYAAIGGARRRTRKHRRRARKTRRHH